MNIGVFGGTFDPPHIGHLILADEALFQLTLDEIYWILTPFPPHKPDHKITPLQYRIEMLHAAIDENDKFRFSSIEINRPPPHYALDTLEEFIAQNPRSNLTYLIGGDSLRDLPTWYEPQKIPSLCQTIGVMRRPNSLIDLNKLEIQIPGVSKKIHFLDVPLLEVSATNIRKAIRFNQPYRYLLPNSVYSVIQKHNLYKH